MRFNFIRLLKSSSILTQCKRYLLITTKERLTSKYQELLKNDLAFEKLSLNLSKELETKTIVNENFEKQFNQITAKLRELNAEIKDLNELIQTCDDTDGELTKLAKVDLNNLNVNILKQKSNLLELLIQTNFNNKISNNDNCLILEVFAGVGGQEAMLFTHSLYEMYKLYSESNGFSFETIEYDTTDIGGIRHASAEISGENVYTSLKYESGVHRVQRVPKTEQKGRVHTSTSAVVILPKVANIEISINPKDLKIDACKSQGPGGQHVNKTESACRITHLPTNITVFCQDQRNFSQNKKRALEILELKLYRIKSDENSELVSHAKKTQVSDTSRSERIRTYNFPQDRITDHRLDDNIFNLENFMLGNGLKLISDSLRVEEKISFINEIMSKN